MRLWIIALLVVCLAVFAWRVWRGASSPLTLVVAFVPLIFLGYQEQRDRALVGRYSDAVSEIAGRRVSVKCQGAAGALVDIGHELGSVRFGPDGPVDYTDIKRSVCKALASYVGSDKRTPTRDQILAVHVLSHEAHHLAGIPDEQLAECRAMQTDAQVARALGASQVDAVNLARAYWIRVYPDMPRAYTSTQCVDGGDLDLHPQIRGWPTAGDHFTG